SLLSFLSPPPPPLSTLFPYTTLFRSIRNRRRRRRRPRSYRGEEGTGRRRSRRGQAGDPRSDQGRGHEGPVEDLERLEHRVRLHRSEEHTSELQSRFDLVCRLLLEKKN